MVVDYSKWDKLELSDDSDVEVHPNVDKKSFIRWKQRDIHEKREQAKFRIKQLEVNLETNEDLLKRVDKLIKMGDEGRKIGIDIEEDVKLAEQGENKEKPAKATSPEQPRYTDMIESMLQQIVAEDGNPKVVLNKIREHRQMIEQAMEDESKEMKRLEEERKEHITSDDIRTGWDSTIVYKPTSSSGAPVKSSGSTAQPAAAASSSSSSSTTIETINSPGSRPKPKVNEDGLEELLPETEEFGKIPKGDMEAAFKYLMQHRYIVTEGQKDALMMSAFEHELAGETQRTESTVWNALLLQYSATLGTNGVEMFFSKAVKRDSQARMVFEQDFTTTFNHIKQRCKILREEHAQSGGAEGEEMIQLHAVDPDTEIAIGVPEENSEGYKIYDALPSDVKKAISSQSIEEINAVLASLPLAEAEDVVAKLSESGALSVENKIYEPQEWEEKASSLKKAAASEVDSKPADDEPADDEAPPSTIDDVD